MDCFICKKHETPERYFGVAISEQSGLMLSHFPFLEDELATRGHLIVEPRRHICEIEDLNASEAAALGPMLQLGTKLIKSIPKVEHVYLFRINDKVKHLHFHLVPRFEGTPRDYWGLQIMTWPERPTLNFEQIQLLSKNLHGGASKV